MNTTRRGLITGLIAFVAAPAIVRAGSLMPIKVLTPGPDYYICTGYYHIKPMDDVNWQLGKYVWITGIDMQADPQWVPLVGDRKPETACSVVD